MVQCTQIWTFCKLYQSINRLVIFSIISFKLSILIYPFIYSVHFIISFCVLPVTSVITLISSSKSSYQLWVKQFFLTFQMHSSKCNPVRIKVSEKSLNIPFLVTRTDLMWVSLRLSRKNQRLVVKMPPKHTELHKKLVLISISYLFLIRWNLQRHCKVY